LDAEILGFLLGISVAVIGVLITSLGLSLRRNSSNPNLLTIDEKLNEILLCLARIDEHLKIGGR